MSNHRRHILPSVNVLSLTALSTMVVATTLASAAVSRADVVAGCAVSEMSSGSQGGCWHPFAGSSPFNTELPTGPKLAADNSAVQQHMATYGWSLDGSNAGFSLSGDGSRPVYFATPADPVMTVNCTSEEGPGTCQGADGISVNGAQINVPAGARPDTNWDAHMTVIETATGTEYDFWHTSVSGSTLTAGSGAEANVNTSDGTGGAGDAANLPLSAGLLRPSELASGQINHALVITAPCTNATGKNVGYTWPATGGWGQYCGQYWNETASTAPMLGQLVKLNLDNAQIANSPAPTWEKTIMTALAHYGAYIEDTNGSSRDESMDILTQDPASWTDLGQPNQWASTISQLGGQNSTLTSTTPIPTSQLQLVDTCVTQGTCPNASTNFPDTSLGVTPPTITPVPAPVGTPPGPVLSGLPTRSSSEPTKARDAPRQSGPSRAPTRRTTSARAARAREAWVRHESKRAHRSRRQRHAAHHHPRRGHRRREGHRIRGGRRR